MAKTDISKLDIAVEYLDAAIGFYMAQQNYFCAIHLSAAAEELFGAHLPDDERIFTLAWKAEKALKSETGPNPSNSAARKSVNEWKNGVKHMDDGTSQTIEIDPAFAAEQHIEHALRNFYKLKLRKSPAVWKFEDSRNEEIQALSGAIANISGDIK